MSSVFSKAAADRVAGAGVTAVLGPTNTGKTHLAIERMVAHSSGVIGLPLRLLAREVYNKVVAKVGAESVALITGEEKIKPPRARFWVSTVEAMPRDLDVSFVAIDEIQLATDLERGHVFTDRILNRRGRDETLILGAATMRPVIERLLPGANIVTRPRLSQLEFAGERKITRQPRRTAIVAFSTDEVYAIAELIRRQHGGAAVVMGSLSPRTRNAQVDMYQSGDVDYLVATDAIGMGLNLDVDHVAFAGDRKYDGYQYRRLNPTEFAQIAGRAGRATRNGTFGTTGRCPPFEPELVNALQNHTFENVRTLQWRNARLDFSSVGALQATLAEVPGHDALTRAPVAEDSRVLDHCARDAEIRDMARSRAAIERLWEVCQVPDYRKVAPAVHAELAVSLYGFLMHDGTIGADWFAQQVMQADRTDGDIDTLSARIAHIRTWTFVANRPDWLADPEHWQGTTRAIEDKLSDALHERLTERFVDRRTSVLMRRLRENSMLETEIGKSGEVIVEGHTIGRLDGFMFAPDAAEAGSDAKALQAAAQKALAGEIDARAERLSQANDDQFALTSEGVIRWMGDAVGKLATADDMLRPRVRILADERLTGAPRDAVQARIDKWLETHIQKLLAPLFEISKAEDITGIARGIAFQLVEALGVIERQKIAAEMKDLDQASRAVLRKYGVRFGAYHIYLPALLKPAARSLASLLWALKQDNIDLSVLSTAQHMASSGRTSFTADPSLDRIAYRTLGYRLAGARAVRVDILERLADLIRPALAWRPGSSGAKPAGAFDGRSFIVTQPMTSLTGAAGEDFASILRALGYRLDRCPPLPEAPASPVQAATAPSGQVSSSNGEMSLAEYMGVPDDTPPAVVEAPSDAAATAASAEISEAAPESRASDSPAIESPAIDATPIEAAAPEASASEAPALELAANEPAAIAPVPGENAAGEAATSEAAASDAPEAAATEVVATEAVATEAATTETAAPLEPATPQLIEVWRIGRNEERKPRPHHGRRQEQAGEGGEQQQHRGRRRRGRGPNTTGDDANAREPNRERRFQHDRAQGPDAQGQVAQGQATEGKAGEAGDKRSRHGRGQGERNRDGGRKFEGNRFEGKQSFRGNQNRNPPQRERQADPNSPFAKLAALKEQLAANAKEPRS